MYVYLKCIFSIYLCILGGTGFKGTLSRVWCTGFRGYSSFQNAKLLKLLFQLNQQLQLPDFFLSSLRKEPTAIESQHMEFCRI